MVAADRLPQGGMESAVGVNAAQSLAGRRAEWLGRQGGEFLEIGQFGAGRASGAVPRVPAALGSGRPEQWALNGDPTVSSKKKGRQAESLPPRKFGSDEEARV